MVTVPQVCGGCLSGRYRVLGVDQQHGEGVGIADNEREKSRYASL
jgi:hypothetical protein